MNRERVVLLDVSEALYEAAERLPQGSPWIDAFCNVAQLVEADVRGAALPASERMRRRGIQARARVVPLASEDRKIAPIHGRVADGVRASLSP
jgi:hypothetical protein